jgi:DNA-binding CsgD family transcriptional regulator
MAPRPRGGSADAAGHLEQIYAKLGVENRASAAALAVRTIGVR